MKKSFLRFGSSRSFASLLSIFTVAVMAFSAMELLFVQQALAAGKKCCLSGATSNSSCICVNGTTCPSTFPSNPLVNGSPALCNFLCGNTANTLRYCSASFPCPSAYPVDGVNSPTNAAKVCPTPLTGVTSSGSMGVTIGSSIICDPQDGPQYGVISGTTTVDFTKVSQLQTLFCKVNSPEVTYIGDASCQLEISYSRSAGLTTSTSGPQCESFVQDGVVLSKLTDVAFCSQATSGSQNNRLVVAGTLNCTTAPDSTSLPPIKLGLITTTGACDNLFPATAQLAEDQVLRVDAILEGPSCEGQLKDFSQPILDRYCDGGFGGGDPLCQTKSGVMRVGLTSVEAAIPFVLDFSPEKINLTCNPTNTNPLRFTVFGNGQLDVTTIDRNSLTVQPAAGLPPGSSPVPATCLDQDLDTVNQTLGCTVPSCPNLGTELFAMANPDGTVDIEVDGLLSLLPPATAPTAIQGIFNTPFSGGK